MVNSNKSTKIPPKEIEALKVELIAISECVNQSENNQKSLQNAMEQMEFDIQQLEQNIEMKKHYFLGKNNINFDKNSRNECQSKGDPMKDKSLPDDSTFDSEASLVKMLKKKMECLQKIFISKNKKLLDCQSTSEYTKLNELEVMVEAINEESTTLAENEIGELEDSKSESKSADSDVSPSREIKPNLILPKEFLVKNRKANNGISKTKENQFEQTTNQNENSIKEKGKSKKERSVSKGKKNRKLKTAFLKNSNKQFLRFHILIESIRRKNINSVNYLQTISSETQHFQELKKKIKNEIAQQTNKIAILQNNLSETKDTFEFCLGKFRNSSYLNYQKLYETSFEFFYQRKESGKKKS